LGTGEVGGKGAWVENRDVISERPVNTNRGKKRTVDVMVGGGRKGKESPGGGLKRVVTKTGWGKGDRRAQGKQGNSDPGERSGSGYERKGESREGEPKM